MTGTATTGTRPAGPDAEPAWVRRAERWLRYDSRFRQSLVVVVAGVFAFAGLRTVDVPAVRATAYGLVGVNVVVTAVRLAPDAVAARVLRPPYYVVAGLLAAGPVALDRSSAALVFGYLLVGNAGFRLPGGQAWAVATGVTGACTAATVAGDLAGRTDVPWWSASFMWLVVLVGIAHRSRGLALAATSAAAESAVQAARAEARAQAMSERARIARDVHDVLAHSLAGINLQLEVVDALLDHGDVGQARVAANRAQRQVREGLAEVSRTVHDLREQTLPLVDTLRSLVESGAPPGTTLEVEGEHRDVPTPRSTALARVAQESLTNAGKHAPGAPVRVRLAFGARVTALDVVNGPGRAPAALAATGGGMGLVGMRERVELVGGRTSAGPVVDGADAGGWRVHAKVPA